MHFVQLLHGGSLGADFEATLVVASGFEVFVESAGALAEVEMVEDILRAVAQAALKDLGRDLKVAFEIDVQPLAKEQEAVGVFQIQHEGEQGGGAGHIVADDELLEDVVSGGIHDGAGTQILERAVATAAEIVQIFVVPLALLRVGKHVKCLNDNLEHLFMMGAVVQVWVVLFSLGVVGFLDLAIRAGWADTEDFVVVGLGLRTHT